MTPQHVAANTPNAILATPYRSAGAIATPGYAPTPGPTAATPLRDGLKLNSDASITLLTPSSTPGQSVRYGSDDSSYY